MVQQNEDPWSSLSQEVGPCSAGQENPHLLWNMKFHYCVHKNPLMDSILSYANPVNILNLFY
jgi:hypothetical protein